MNIPIDQLLPKYACNREENDKCINFKKTPNSTKFFSTTITIHPLKWQGNNTGKYFLAGTKYSTYIIDKFNSKKLSMYKLTNLSNRSDLEFTTTFNTVEAAMIFAESHHSEIVLNDIKKIASENNINITIE